MRFYTYMWLRADATPYYVGKGIGNRAFVSTRHSVGCPKEKSRILIQFWSSEAEAFEMEKYYIRLFGRKDNGTGILRNLTDGGEGWPVGTKHTAATKEKVRTATKAAMARPEVKRKQQEGLADYRTNRQPEVMRKRYESLEERKSTSTSVKSALADPTVKANMISAQCKAQSASEVRVKNAERAVASWKNPVIRAKRLAGMKAQRSA